MATFNSLNKAIDRIGPEEVKMITDALVERLEKQRAAGSASAAKHKPDTSH